jgi:hypothetical protein
MEEKKARKTTIYLDPELVKALKQRAKENKRSFNSEIAWGLEQYLKEGKDANTERS